MRGGDLAALILTIVGLAVQALLVGYFITGLF